MRNQECGSVQEIPVISVYRNLMFHQRPVFRSPEFKDLLEISVRRQGSSFQVDHHPDRLFILQNLTKKVIWPGTDFIPHSETGIGSPLPRRYRNDRPHPFVPEHDEPGIGQKGPDRFRGDRQLNPASQDHGNVPLGGISFPAPSRSAPLACLRRPNNLSRKSLSDRPEYRPQKARFRLCIPTVHLRLHRTRHTLFSRASAL